ncbi:MAG: hypothetical protein Q9226_005971 [Calogaya cf. arnoldii]
MSESAPVEPPGVFPAPPGVTPNFVNPTVRTCGMIPLICVFLTLSTVSLVLRLYTKVRIIRVWGLEDIAVTLGWMCTTVMMAIFWWGLSLGAGAHIWNMKLEFFGTYSKAASATISLNPPASALPKIAILIYFLRLNPKRSFRFGTLAVLFLTLAYMISFLLVQVFQCRPVEKWWKPLIAGKCTDITPVYIAVPVVNMCIDIFILLLPIPMLIQLQVNMRTKLALSAIFAVSSCTVVISAVRVWAIQQILGASDITWVAAPSNSLIIVELNTTVVCANIMVLRPFCRRHLPFLLGFGKSQPTDEKSPNAEAVLAFDGPSGPRSKSGYRTKIIAGSGGPKRSGKRNLWPSMGSTLVREDDDDMESLSHELNTLAPHSQSNGRGRNRVTAGENANSLESIGAPRSGLHNPHPRSREDDPETGIMKTVSLDVR